MSFRTKAGFAIFAVATSSLVAAQTYVGGSIGQSSTRFNAADYSVGDPTIVSESQDKTDTAYKLFVGHNFNKVWAIEGGYADLGKSQYKYTGVGALAGAAGQANIDQSSWFVAGKGTFAISEQFNLFGKLGVTRNKSKLTANTDNAVLNAALGFPVTLSKTKTDLLLGVGAGYSFSKQFGLRFEYEDFGKFGDQNTTGRTRAHLWSLGLEYRF